MTKRNKPTIEGQLYAVVKNFNSSREGGGPNTDTVTADLSTANVMTSMVAENLPMHKPVIDIDFPVFAVESSTPGHGHLIIDKEMSSDDYFKLLKVMVEVGLVEEGFYDASFNRGYTAVRLPWVKKTEAEYAHQEMVKKAQEGGFL